MNIIVFILGAIAGGLAVWLGMKQGVKIAINELCRRQDIKIQELKDTLSQKDANITELKVIYATLKRELDIKK